MSPVPRTPLNIRADTESAVDRAAGQLRQQILKGTLPPGKRLSELELAADMSVSRLTIRLALEELQRLGLAERREGGGLQVTVHDARSLAEVSAVALILWKPALLETDFMDDDATVAGVIGALRHMVSLLDDGYAKDGAEFAMAFFAIFTPIIELTQNRVWLGLHKILETRAALGVRGFTNDIDIHGVQVWATALEAAFTSRDRRATFETFAALTQLSTRFAEQTVSPDEGAAPL
jgi:DNA-binding GntR family transcriptional regulator